MTSERINRREFLGRATGAALVGAFATPFLSKSAYGASATPKFEILETKTIASSNDYYFGWPTIARRGDELIVVASGGREGHGCPCGRVEMIRSKDSGATWSYPQILYDSPVDDRDAGAVPAQGDRRLPADAGGASGDNRNLTHGASHRR